MQRLRTKNTELDQNRTRCGVTLIEVLMSMMIMAIGVSLVMALFPISAIRTAQATKMTNAAVLKYNVESVVERQPHLLFDPNGDYQFLSGDLPDLLEHVSSPRERNYIVDPNGYFAHADAGATFGVDPPNTPYVGGDPTYLVADRGFCDYFGNKKLNNVTPLTPFTTLPRYDGGVRAAYFNSGVVIGTSLNNRALRQVASRISGLGDGWSTEIDAFADETTPIVVGNAGVLLSEDFNLADFPTSITDTPGYDGLEPPSNLVADPELSRITVFSVNGRFSQSYVLTAVTGSGANAGRQCLWSEDVNLNGTFDDDEDEDLNQNGAFDTRGLPTEFGGVVGRVLIERRRTHDFNWLLTVRRSGDGRAIGVDVVVTYNNGVTPSDERVFTTAAGNGFSKNSFAITIPATSGVDEVGEAVEPHLRRSGYVLDVDNARWYRISDYEDVVGSSPATIKVTLETTPSENSPGNIGNAIFLPSVVDVFPLGTVEYPGSYPALSGF
jgi:prepilin-type N-terminal cleavage/methylation domain-containing protein